MPATGPKPKRSRSRLIVTRIAPGRGSPPSQASPFVGYEVRPRRHGGGRDLTLSFGTQIDGGRDCTEVPAAWLDGGRRQGARQTPHLLGRLFDADAEGQGVGVGVGSRAHLHGARARRAAHRRRVRRWRRRRRLPAWVARAFSPSSPPSPRPSRQVARRGEIGAIEWCVARRSAACSAAGALVGCRMCRMTLVVTACHTCVDGCVGLPCR